MTCVRSEPVRSGGRTGNVATLGEPARERLRPITAQPSGTVLAFDFDGTLSPIVSDPADAVLADGVRQLLHDLHATYRRVVLVSGRPLSFLAGVVPGEVDVVALYGLEGRNDGVTWEHSVAGAWREAVADVAAVARARLPAGVNVELKGLSLTLHFRNAPDAEAAVLALAREQAARSGLEQRSAKQSVELHPPVPVDKGTSLHDLARGATGVLFAGDDHGDLLGFDALDQLAAAGVAAVKVAVASAESPPELVDRADIVVSPGDEVLALLSALRNGDGDGARGGTQGTTAA